MYQGPTPPHACTCYVVRMPHAAHSLLLQKHFIKVFFACTRRAEVILTSDILSDFPDRRTRLFTVRLASGFMRLCNITEKGRMVAQSGIVTAMCNRYSVLIYTCDARNITGL